MGESGANKKIANGLVALSSAAILVVYSAGYQRTKAAADRFERLAASRRQAIPVPSVTAPAPAPGAAPAIPAVPSRDGVPSGPPAAIDKGLEPPGPQASAPAVPPAGAARAGTAATDSNTASPVAAESAAATATATAPPAPTAPVAAEPPQPAGATVAEITPITPPERGRFKDGTYQGRGSCIHGDIQAEVVVKNGRIVTATISSCETRYSCDWLDPILPQVAARQSAFVDYVSGATDSTDAFSAAVTDALLKAQ